MPELDSEFSNPNPQNKIHTSLINMNDQLSETIQTQDFMNTQDTTESKDSSIYNLGQRGAFSNPYQNLINGQNCLFTKNGSKPTITDYTRDNTIDDISQMDLEEAAARKINFGRPQNSKFENELFSKSVQESVPQMINQVRNSDTQLLDDDIEESKPKETVRSERAYPRIHKALNATLKDFFFVDEDEESSLFDEFDMMNV